MSQAHVLETICVKFHQNRPSRLGFRADTDTHTDRQPGSILTYSVKMTEYKKLNYDTIFDLQKKIIMFFCVLKLGAGNFSKIRSIASNCPTHVTTI